MVNIITSTVGDLYSIDLLNFDRFHLAQIYNIASPVINDTVHWFKIIGAIISIGAFIALVIIVKKIAGLQVPQTSPTIIEELNPPQPAPTGAMANRWQEILKHMESAQESQWKLAIIEADKLIDLVMKKAGFAGENLGERLMNIQPGQLASLDGLWEAHKVRNQIAHQMDYFLRYTEAKKVISLYEAALSELQAI